MEEFLESAHELSGELGLVALDYGLNSLGALIILILGWWAAAMAHSWTMRGLGRIERLDVTLKPLLGSIVRYVILIITVVAVLSEFGVQIASIIAVLGAAGLAVGLALQGTLQNIAAGIMLLFLRPFKVGDYIDAEGAAGTVVEIGLFTTLFTTFDGVFVSCPYSKIWNARIVNYSRNSTRRLDVPVGIAYDDVEGAKAALMGLLQDVRVLSEPAPEVMVTELGDSAVVVNLRCWVANSDYWAFRFHLIEAAKKAVQDAGMSIPFPQRDVHLYGVAAAQPSPAPTQ